MTPIWLRIVGGVAVAWNAIGVFSYLNHVGIVSTPEPTPEGMPPLVTAAFAVGVFAAVAGSAGLALGRRWAVPLLWVSLAGLVIDWGWVFANAPQGWIGLGLTVLAISAVLAFLGTQAARRGWLS